MLGPQNIKKIYKEKNISIASVILCLSCLWFFGCTATFFCLSLYFLGGSGEWTCSDLKAKAETWDLAHFIPH